jgi:hypothetical protein
MPTLRINQTGTRFSAGGASQAPDNRQGRAAGRLPAIHVLQARRSRAAAGYRGVYHHGVFLPSSPAESPG